MYSYFLKNKGTLENWSFLHDVDERAVELRQKRCRAKLEAICARPGRDFNQMYRVQHDSGKTESTFDWR